MPDILVRDLDKELVARLKERARRNGRSLQAEVRMVLENLARDDASREAAWDLAAEIQQQLAGTAQTDSAELVREDRDR